MSIFSRKSKPGQSQSVGAKANGHAPPAGPNKHAYANGAPDAAPVDPILQRMAIQAESRKRMNSQTPDYSIKSTSSSPVLPPPSSQDALFARTMTADSTLAPIEAASQPRDPRKLRKSNSKTPSLAMHTPAARAIDPDTQKVRMPPWDTTQALPQVSRDSGYASVAPMPTVVSGSQSELNALPDSELLRRQRLISAASPPHDGASRTLTASSPAPPAIITDAKARTAPSTPTRNDIAARYVSRLDPGSASSSFLTSSVLPDISKPKPTEVDRGRSVPIRSHNNGDYRAEPPKRVEESPKPTPNMSRPRESQPRPAKLEQLTKAVSQNTGRRGSDASLSKRPESARQALPPSPVLSRGSIVQKTKDQDSPLSRSAVAPEGRPTALAALAAPTGAAVSQYQAAQPSSTSSTPFQTPRETPATLSEPPNRLETSEEAGPPIALSALTISPSWAEATFQSDRLKSLQADIPNTDLVDAQDATPIPLPSPKPHDEFPYLAGLNRGPAVPPVSVLEGFKVNRRGQILDEEGQTIGELVSGEVVHCVRRKVNKQGEILNDEGNVVGQAVALPRKTDEVEDDVPAANFSGDLVAGPVSTLSPMATFDSREIASTLSRQTRISQRSNSLTERTLNNSDTAGNVVYIELDASTDSQAVPLMDQSDIFIPPYGGSQGKTRSKSVTNLAEIKRIADGRRSIQSPSYTPSASQDKNVIDERRKSTRHQMRQDLSGTTSESASGAPDRPRSFSLMTNTAPKAVLGPTWESLLDTVPDRSQSFAQHKSVIIDGKLASQTSMPSSASNYSTSSAGGSAGGKYASGAAAPRPRRASQNTLNMRNSTHQTFVKSPLSSIANTPPDTATGDGSEASFARQLTERNLGAMQTSSGQDRAGQLAEEEDESAAPAPTIMKRATVSVKPGRKRKSFFGIPFGRSKPVTATN